MQQLSRSELERYLKSVLDPAAAILNLKMLGELGETEIKGFGYGTPVLIVYRAQGKEHQAVLHTISPGPFGHEHMSDRAQILLWEHSTFNHLPRHVRSIDAGAIRRNGTAVSLGDAEEFFILTEYVEGRSYSEDLARMKDDPAQREIDSDRANALCDYLVDIHKVRGDNPDLYVRRIRELVGHSECIMGLIDSYPERNDAIDRSRFRTSNKSASIGDGD